VVIAGNILGEATTPSGNIFNEATRGGRKNGNLIFKVWLPDQFLPFSIAQQQLNSTVRKKHAPKLI
jgi:hypothetical protein